MTRSSALTLALGLVALGLGRLLLGMAPSPATDPAQDFAFPDAVRVLGATLADPFTPRAPKTPSTQTATIRQDDRNFAFYRFEYPARSTSADLVPWFPELFDKRWVKVSGAVRGSGIRVNALILEQVQTGEKRSLVYTLRVGPYITPSFNYAKLAQIPAKLTGNATFEILVLTGPCEADCRADSATSAALLARIIEHNID